jgi:hypothetical protein
VVKIHGYGKMNKIEYLKQFYTIDQIEKYTAGNSDKIDELWNSSQPKKIKIGNLKNQKLDKTILVSSPDGWVSVEGCVEKIKSEMYHFTFSSGRKITASHDHLYQSDNGMWHYAKDCMIGDTFISNDGIDKIIAIDITYDPTKVYDLSVDHENHRYFTNGICSHNTGKSLFLQNIALNWMEMGLHGIYITLELSEELVAMRIDSMVTGVCSKDIFKNLDDVELKISMAGKKYGRLKIKYMPSQSSVNQIKAYIKELAIQENFQPDFVCLDYLDLIMPSGSKVDVADVFTKDKLVCEELRNFSIEQHMILVTASQLNRNGFDEIEFSNGSIAGGISKLFTADNVFGIFTNRSMKERGAIQLQFMKTRNSGGVGNKVDLDFDVNSLRITNSTQATDEESAMIGSNMLEKIRNKKEGSLSNAVATAGPIDNKKDLIKSLLGSINSKS